MERALRLGVNGWVRNLPDGRLEAVFEGEENPVKSLIEFCKQGPSRAIVTDVDVKWENPIMEFSSFKVRY